MITSIGQGLQLSPLQDVLHALPERPPYSYSGRRHPEGRPRDAGLDPGGARARTSPTASPEKLPDSFTARNENLP